MVYSAILLDEVTVRVFKTKGMTRYTRREKIADADLLETIDRAKRGLIDADLGGGLIKQRIARKGQGKSGGYRVIVAYREQHRVVFLYGFAKSDLDNISSNQLEAFRTLGASWLSANTVTIQQAIDEGELQEITP